MDVIFCIWYMDVIPNSHLMYRCYTLYLVYRCYTLYLVYRCYTLHLRYGCYTQHLMYGCYTPDVSVDIILQIQFDVLVTFDHTQEITQIL